MLRTRLIISAAALAALAIGIIALDRLLPPSLARFEDRSTIVTDASGGVLRVFTTRDGMYRLLTTPDDVEPRYLDMLKAYEDRRFGLHPGVDPMALVRAAWQAVRHGRVVSGGSTLTMQTARLLEPHPRNLAGKLADIARALQLSLRHSDREILAIYLTLAPFGGNLEGVRAASLAYFGKEPKHLTDAQAALLVALPQSPTKRRPDLNPALAEAARAKVLERLGETATIAPERLAEAREERTPSRRAAFPFSAPHLTDRLAAAAPRGTRIVTTIDGGLQRKVETLAAREAAMLGDGAVIAVLVVDRERAVRAHVGGTDYFGPQGQNDMTEAERSPGSTLKPFIYAMAFDDLVVHPETLIDDRPMRFGTYAPRNFDHGFRGTVPVRQALQQSLNVPAIAILDRIGPERFAATLRRAGAELVFPRSDKPAALPLGLGGVGMSLEGLVMLYAGLQAGGQVRPLVVTGAPATSSERLASATAAAYVTHILADAPLPDGMASRSGRRDAGWIAFKTGTSYGYRDAWAIGYSATHTIGVWVGRPEGSARPDASGRNTAAPVLFKLFDLLPSTGRQPLPKPGRDGIEATSAGQLPAGLRRFASASSVADGTAPTIVYPPHGTLVDVAAAEKATLALIAEGGEAPLQWIVNGVPLPSANADGQGAWTVDGEGFVQITVLDKRGRTASSTVRLKSER